MNSVNITNLFSPGMITNYKILAYIQDHEIRKNFYCDIPT